MDDQKLPVSLQRLFTRVKQAFKQKSNQVMLTGAEISNLINKHLLSPRVKNPSHKFVAALEGFLGDIC